jgi:adenylate cyclase
LKDSAARKTLLQRPTAGIGRLLLFGLAVTALCALLYVFQPAFSRSLDLRLYDVFLRQNPPGTPSADIAIVDIDEKSLERHGQWPWPRYRFARLLRAVRELGASAVGLDMMFAEADATSLSIVRQNIEGETGRAVPLENISPALLDNDAALAEALHEGPFVLGYRFLFAEESGPAGPCLPHPVSVAAVGAVEIPGPLPLHRAEGVVCNLPQLSEAVTSSGFFNVVIDSDGILRRVPLLIEYDGRYYPSLALATLMKARDIKLISVRVDSGRPSKITAGRFTIPVDADGNLLIRFHRKGKTCPSLSAADVLSGAVPARSLEGKIAFVGTSAAGLGERRATPVDAFLPGVEVHATVSQNILQENFVLRPSWIPGLEMLLVIAAGLLSTLLLIRTGAGLSLAALIALAAGLWIFSGGMFRHRGMFVSPLIPLVTIVASFSLLTLLKFRREEKTARERARELALTKDFTIMCLATLIETRHRETGSHILRCQRYVKALSQRLASRPGYGHLLHEETIDLLYKSAPLHDIGKVGVSDRVLLKPGKLDEEEYGEIKKHTAYGRDAIERAEARFGPGINMSFLRTAKEMAYSHHEHWDGSGYPEGLAGENIPLSGRIMALADVYDALKTSRPYKPAVGHDEAVAFISQQRGIIFDPDLVDVFLEIHEEFRRIAEHFPD